MTTKYPKTTFKTFTQQQIRAEQQKRIEQTGLRWTFYWVGDGWRLLPAITRQTRSDSQMAEAIKSYITDKPRSFVDIAKAAGMEISDVMSGAAWLIHNGFCFADTGRSNECVALHYTVGVWRELQQQRRSDRKTQFAK